MKLLVFVTLLVLMNCSTEERRGIDVTLSLEVVKWTNQYYPVALLMKAKVKNTTRNDYFFYAPDLQSWYSYKNKRVVTTGPSLTDFSFFDTSKNRAVDTIGNLHFALADFILQDASRSKKSSDDIQRFIFAANILFLKAGEETELTRGITDLQNVGGKCKLVASSRDTVQKKAFILGHPPSEFKGYRFWKGRLLSDTLYLTLK